jgi:hypothetical protein
MKQYRVFLEVAAASSLFGRDVADCFNLPLSSFVRHRVGRERWWRHWRYQPCEEYAEKLYQAVFRIDPSIDARGLPRDSGIGKITLGLEVRYDTVTCTVFLDRAVLDAMLTRIPALHRVRLQCFPVEEEYSGDVHGDSDMGVRELPNLYAEWVAAERPAPRRARAPLVLTPSRPHPRRGATATDYDVSLDALTSPLVTEEEVGEALGLPAEVFVRRDEEDGAWWSCEVQADDAEGLGAQIRFLASAIGARRRGRKIREIYLDLAVYFDESRDCMVTIPVSGLRALLRKVPELDYVRVSCYPCSGESG